jgi:hypothetical protein
MMPKGIVMKHVVRMLGMLAIAYIVFLLMLYVEIEVVLNELIIPTTGTTEAWLDIFRSWATVGIFGSLVAGLGWYSLAQWGLRVKDWRMVGKRPVWFLLVLVPAALSVLACIFTDRPLEGELYTYVFYVLNNFVTYYIGTALFSPSAYMYIPLGATKLRRWKLAFLR